VSKMDVKDVRAIIERRLSLAWGRFWNAVEKAEQRVVRELQYPLPTNIEKRFEIDREGTPAVVCVKCVEVRDDGGRYDDQAAKAYFQEGFQEGIAVWVGVAITPTGETRGIYVRMRSMGGREVYNARRVLEVVADMRDPLFADVVIKALEGFAEEMERWMKEVERRVERKVEENTELIERWEAELAVGSLEGGEER